MLRRFITNKAKTDIEDKIKSLANSMRHRGKGGVAGLAIRIHILEELYRIHLLEDVYSFYSRDFLTVDEYNEYKQRIENLDKLVDYGGD